MKRRVVVTGLGAVTPIGNDVESFWNGVKEGKVGIGPITRFDTTGYKATLAQSLKICGKGSHGPENCKKNGAFFPVCGSSCTGSSGKFRA